jgi:hypothetical protein
MNKRFVVLGFIVALMALLTVSILGTIGSASPGDVQPQYDYKAL